MKILYRQTPQIKMNLSHPSERSTTTTREGTSLYARAHWTRESPFKELRSEFIQFQLYLYLYLYIELFCYWCNFNLNILNIRMIKFSPRRKKTTRTSTKFCLSQFDPGRKWESCVALQSFPSFLSFLPLAILLLEPLTGPLALANLFHYKSYYSLNFGKS